MEKELENLSNENEDLQDFFNKNMEREINTAEL
jgi:hypothetical protein